MSSREELLKEAIEAITKQRNNTYGPPTQDFTRTAELWSTLFRNKIGDQDFEAHEVAMAMMALKLSRLTWSPEHKDSWLDAAGYAACGWECVEPSPLDEVIEEASIDYYRDEDNPPDWSIWKRQDGHWYWWTPGNKEWIKDYSNNVGSRRQVDKAEVVKILGLDPR